MPALRSQRGESHGPCRVFNNPSLATPRYHTADSIQRTLSLCRKVVLSCGRIALCHRFRALVMGTAEIEAGDREFAIYLRGAPKNFPVVREKIPVNVTREF